MPKIRFYRHNRAKDGTPNGKAICKRKLPVRQTLVWMGPVFILIQKGA